jgi:hypothetical protein
MVKVIGKLTDIDTLSGIDQTPLYLNDTLVGVTDDDGNYDIDVKPGEYRLAIRPREFLPLLCEVRIDGRGQMIDQKTGRPLKKTIPLVRATL